MNLLILNGSPRGPASNTRILIRHFMEGFGETPGNHAEEHLLAQRSRHAEHRAAFGRAEAVILAFPLYVHAMPGLVKQFVESLAPREPIHDVTLGFIVQSGFPEGHHSRWLEPWLERLPARLGCRYAGTVVKGGVEGIQLQPPWLTRGLFRRFHSLGAQFGRTGAFDARLVRQLAEPEWLSLPRRAIYQILVTTGLADFYWRMNLKKNDAWDERFARPLAEESQPEARPEAQPEARPEAQPEVQPSDPRA